MRIFVYISFFAFQLALHVVDKGVPSLENTAELTIVVKSKFKDPPVFCNDQFPCRQTINLLGMYIEKDLNYKH